MPAFPRPSAFSFGVWFPAFNSSLIRFGSSSGRNAVTPLGFSWDRAILNYRLCSPATKLQLKLDFLDFCRLNSLHLLLPSLQATGYYSFLNIRHLLCATVSTFPSMPSAAIRTALIVREGKTWPCQSLFHILRCCTKAKAEFCCRIERTGV